VSPPVVFLVAAPVVTRMSREFTFFQFDVDEETLRSVLASIPGVTPVSADEEDAPEAGTSAADAESDSSRTGVEAVSPTDADAGPAGTDAGSPGVEAHLDDTPDPDRPTATAWTRPSTPWPGAPTDEPDDEDEGIVARVREKKLLIGGIAAGLGVVGAVAVWFLKFRDGDGGGGPVGDDVARSGSSGVSRDPTPDEPHADDADSRDYPVDAAPVVGMAFLAVATVLLRRFGGADGE